MRVWIRLASLLVLAMSLTAIGYASGIDLSVYTLTFKPVALPSGGGPVDIEFIYAPKIAVGNGQFRVELETVGELEYSGEMTWEFEATVEKPFSRLVQVVIPPNDTTGIRAYLYRDNKKWRERFVYFAVAGDSTEYWARDPRGVVRKKPEPRPNTIYEALSQVTESEPEVGNELIPLAIGNVWHYRASEWKSPNRDSKPYRVRTFKIAIPADTTLQSGLWNRVEMVYPSGKVDNWGFWSNRTDGLWAWDGEGTPYLMAKYPANSNDHYTTGRTSEMLSVEIMSLDTLVEASGKAYRCLLYHFQTVPVYDGPPSWANAFLCPGEGLVRMEIGHTSNRIGQESSGLIVLESHNFAD